MIICDSREKKNSHILRYFASHNIPYKITLMAIADYAVEDNGTVVVDRKQNLEEVCRNLTYKGKTANENGGKKIPSDVARFWREVRRAYENDIEMIVLVEHGEGIRQLRDVAFWNGSRSGITGRQLLDEMDRVTAAYGVKWTFCDKRETAREILYLLGYKEDGE